MRLLIVFKARKLPRHHHFLFASLVKSALATSNSQMQYEMYHYTPNQANKEMRPFTGAIYLNDYTLEDGEFTIHQDVRLTISSSNTEFLLNVYNGFVQKKSYRYQSYELFLEHIKMLPEKLPKTNRVLFKTLSSIVIKDRDGKYLDLHDENYQTELNYAANECMKAVAKRFLYKPITLTPVVMNKKVVQLKHDSFAALNAQSILYMNAYEGTFLLEGAPEDLDILAQAGLGFRRSIFFGCIEMINE
ncbi:CRISPR-associated endoribonuclease Cas6 [Bacillus pseudomycoides]|nr:CRISPR-associated endoribonuclease Cas6 [Bacillus pseudomycoides]